MTTKDIAKIKALLGTKHRSVVTNDDGSMTILYNRHEDDDGEEWEGDGCTDDEREAYEEMDEVMSKLNREGYTVEHRTSADSADSFLEITTEVRDARLAQLRAAKKMVQDMDARSIRAYGSEMQGNGFNIMGESIYDGASILACSVYLDSLNCNTKADAIACIDREISLTLGK